MESCCYGSGLPTWKSESSGIRVVIFFSYLLYTF
jgi:hypothetical protein